MRLRKEYFIMQGMAAHGNLENVLKIRQQHEEIA
jgi:ribosomal protein L29